MFDAVVVGAGVIGLTSALCMQRMGLRTAVVSADAPSWTTSSVAAAAWFPVGVAEGPAVMEWAARGFEVFARQAADGVPGVVMRRTRMLWRSPVTDVPWWAVAVTDLRRLDADEAGAPFTGAWTFTAPCVEMPLYLPWLRERLLHAGGTLVEGRVSTLADAADLAPVLVNATGLAAGALCPDPTVRPVRGQLVLVRNPGLSESVRDQDNPAGYTYVHPRSDDVVLGGTFEEGRWDTMPCLKTARAILHRCVALEARLAKAPVIAYPVGLRPARSGGVRLEADPEPLPNGARLIHNYGHAGAGVTLAWGCAEAAAALASGHRSPRRSSW